VLAETREAMPTFLTSFMPVRWLCGGLLCCLIATPLRAQNGAAADREKADRDTTDRETTDRETTDRDTTDRDTTDRETTETDDGQDVAFFEKRIRPVLVERCYECHGEESDAEGGLRLDSRAGWQTGGDSGPALVPGKPATSLLIRAIRYDDPNLQMPPDGKLPDSVIRDFEQWVQRGAADPRQGSAPTRSERPLDLAAAREFWAYRLPQAGALPPVRDTTWPAAGVDHYILAELERAGLRAADEADRSTLIRRLYFDLIGLPPTPPQIDEFQRDERSDAYARLVDRLLESPHFGERWGRHWLDVARYAESMTLRGFVFPEAWRYRDYVIESFNQDRPFHQMVREHVAGDLLPAESLEERQRQLIATTFLVLGNTNLEEQDKAQLRMDVVDEQLEAIGRAFLAQTIGCARCHDHKFDPIPTRDYYALATILRNTKTLEHANVSKWLEVNLPLPDAQEQAIRAHEEEIAALENRLKEQKAVVAQIDQAAGGGGPAILAADKLPGIVVDDLAANKVGEWKLSLYSGRYIGDGYLHDLNESKGAKTITFLPELPRAGRYEVRLAYTPGTNRATNVPVTVFSADGEFELKINERENPPIDGRFISLGQFSFELNGQGFVIISNEATDGHVIADAVQFIPVDELARLSKPEPTGKDLEARDAANAALKQLEAELKKLKDNSPRRPLVMSVLEEKEISDSHVHIRGNVHNLGEPVTRGFLQVADYQPLPTFDERHSGRRELADWLASERNPLTARVYVNRAWHWLMGAGLVRTTDNFGTTGELPSHPQLLDYLAVDFMTNGWSTKHLVRQIVLSRSYRLSSVASPEAREADPENRLWARAHRRRLEAECLRDAMLLISGRLQLEMGGSTIRPGTTADYGYQHNDARRSVYSPVFRNALPEFFEAFDFADPSVVSGRRNVSTVAPQALFMMNHPFVRQQAQHTAQRLLTDHGDDRQRLEFIFRAALGRLPTDDEAVMCDKFLSDLAAAGSPAARQEAWTQLAHALFASLDFRYAH
jgi:hypothetical protein